MIVKSLRSERSASADSATLATHGLLGLVRTEGLEPPRDYSRQFLKLVRLPLHHARPKNFDFGMNFGASRGT